jgi:nucleotide-binding universal stress UspA family protein
MPNKIMVPLDGSAFSEQAVEYAVGAARLSGAALHFVRVHGSTLAPDPSRPWGTDAAADQALRDNELAYLDRFSFTPRAAGLAVRIVLLTGPVVDALADYVVSEGITQVIMTTHGRGGLSRVWLGSVADSLVRRVDVPVVLLRPRQDTRLHGTPFSAGHIVLPVDGSEWSERVVNYAVTLGELSGARYSLVHVMAPPIAAVPGAEIIAVEDLAEFRANAVASLEKLANAMRAKGLDVETSVVMQTQIASGIVEYALECGADMIAMATHGRRGWARVMLGSVADKVLRSSHVPLMLLPPDSIVEPEIAKLAS